MKNSVVKRDMLNSKLLFKSCVENLENTNADGAMAPILRRSARLGTVPTRLQSKRRASLRIQELARLNSSTAEQTTGKKSSPRYHPIRLGHGYYAVHSIQGEKDVWCNAKKTRMFLILWEGCDKMSWQPCEYVSAGCIAEWMRKQTQSAQRKKSSKFLEVASKCCAAKGSTPVLCIPGKTYPNVTPPHPPSLFLLMWFSDTCFLEHIAGGINPTLDKHDDKKTESKSTESKRNTLRLQTVEK